MYTVRKCWRFYLSSHHSYYDNDVVGNTEYSYDNVGDEFILK